MIHDSNYEISAYHVALDQVYKVGFPKLGLTLILLSNSSGVKPERQLGMWLWSQTAFFMAKT